MELKESDLYTRGMFATRDLHPGDIIAISEPALKGIHATSVYKRCSNCLHMNFMNTLACVGCVTTMFCSEKCRSEAMEKFHQHECRMFIDDFRRTECRFADLAVHWRFFFEAQHIAGGFEQLKAICEDPQLAEKTIFDYDLRNELNRFLALFCVVNCFPQPEPLKETAAERWTQQGPMWATWQSEKEKEDVKMILKKLSSFDCDPLIDDPNFCNVYATGCSVEGKFFNHSCMPNITIVLVNTQKHYFVSWPIKAGEEIFQSYR